MSHRGELVADGILDVVGKHKRIGDAGNLPEAFPRTANLETPSSVNNKIS